ncbi:MAG: hypothetical protein ACTSX6_12040 [Candidatus Heimdallarchaeaceae archaeon]
METFERILEVIEKYGYVLIFFGTFLIDNSGIPLFIIAAGIMVALKKLNGFVSFFLIFSGLIAWDNLLYFAGICLNKFLSKKIQKEKKINKQVLKILIKVIDTGYVIFENNKKLFFFFCKIIPWIGKIAPIFAGYGNRGATSLLYFAMGDLWYCSVFYFVALLMGAVIVKYSKLIGLLGFLLFLFSYYFSRNTVKKKLPSLSNY